MRKIITALATLVLVITLALPASAGTFKLNTAVFTIGSTSYTFNGQTETMDVAPVIVDGRTMLPIRYFAYGMGIPQSDVVYLTQSTAPGYAGDQEVDITDKIDQDGFDVSSLMQILYNSSNFQDAVIVRNHMYTFEGRNNALSLVKAYGVGPEIINGRLMLPLRALVEQNGASTITWNGNTDQVTVVSPQTSG